MSDMGPLEAAARRSRERAGIASPTVDSNARRQAILFEVAAVATRYENDQAPATARERSADLRAQLEHLDLVSLVAVEGSEHHYTSTLELAGRCVAWLEHLAENEAKA
jgi:hypothetical protein